MSFLDGLGNGISFVALTSFWALLVVAVAIVIVIGMSIGIGKFIAARKPVDQPIHFVTNCDISGHHFQPRDIGWLCANCDEAVPYEVELPDRNDDAASTPMAA